MINSELKIGYEFDIFLLFKGINNRNEHLGIGLITDLFQKPKKKYFLIREEGEPVCYEFKSSEYSFSNIFQLTLGDAHRIPFSQPQKNIADKILSRRGF